MSIKTTILFDTTRSEIISTLRKKIKNCNAMHFVTGFATVEGVKALTRVLKANPTKLKTIVVGAATYRSCEALDELSGLGVPQSALWIHLGHSKPTSPGAKYPFYRYHPMLHSKVYYLDMPNGKACAFVGSHNLTGFALLGKNGEASVMLEGDRTLKEFKDIRAHIDQARTEATAYDPAFKQAYAEWTKNYFEGLSGKSNDAPRTDEAKRTIVIFAAVESGAPKKDDIIYFELSAASLSVNSTNTEVHLFVFDPLPPDPQAALAQIKNAKASFWCQIVGVENDQGGKELTADWEISDRRAPTLRVTNRPFRPMPMPDMQQVRVKVFHSVSGEFDYQFETTSKKWIPIFDENRGLLASEYDDELYAETATIPNENVNWMAVTGFQPAEGTLSDGYKEAMREFSPSAGSYVLFAPRRRKR